ncbi:MAG: CRISPR-associated endonuclease Cas2 [Candidatus Eremiobacterota bacterium]
MFYIIAYDTPSDSRRRRLAKAIEGYATRVQKSVFETNIKLAKFKEMIEKARDCIDEKEDNLRIYEIPRDYLGKVRIYGKLPLVKEQSFYYV